MTDAEARAALDALIRSRGESFAGLSRMLGRNAAYLQQHVQRGSPRRLDEGDRRLLAAYFGVPESRLGGSAQPPVLDAERADYRDPDAVIRVPRYDVAAAAGGGAVVSGERPAPRFGFRAAWLKELSASPPSALSLIRVEGGSMAPTLSDGDDILVDRNDASARLRDGIYVLRIDDRLSVKRLAVSGRRFTVRSDNPAYPDWPAADAAEAEIVGRVLWTGRRV